MGRQEPKSGQKKVSKQQQNQRRNSHGKHQTQVYWDGWKQSFNEVMKANNGYTADGKKVCSYATQAKRSGDILQGLKQLREMGYKFKTVYAIKGKHINVLVKHWHKSGLSASTIQNRLSNFRVFTGWLGKAGMIRDVEHYLGKDITLKRSYSASVSRSWSDQGVDTISKIAAVTEENWRFGKALELQLAFGLRTKESLLLRVHLADKGNVLIVEHGTKGGRTRYIPIETPEQRQLLDELKEKLKLSESLVPKEQTYVQCRNGYYYVLRKYDIKREKGITGHGLRHEHMHNVYTEATGCEPAVKGGTLHREDKELDSYGRELVAERAGHSRESVSAAYLGGKSKQQSQE